MLQRPITSASIAGAARSVMARPSPACPILTIASAGTTWDSSQTSGFWARKLRSALGTIAGEGGGAAARRTVPRLPRLRSRAA
jgi:hypothetical protein